MLKLFRIVVMAASGIEIQREGAVSGEDSASRPGWRVRFD
jgi:hypothetical protein